MSSALAENRVQRPAFTRGLYPSLRGKRVVVTGGGSGIGAALVEAFAWQGAAVAYLDNSVDASRALEPGFLRHSGSRAYTAADAPVAHAGRGSAHTGAAMPQGQGRAGGRRLARAVPGFR